MKRKNKKSKEDQRPIYKFVSTGTLILRIPRYIRIKPKQEVEISEEELGERLHLFELVKDGTGKFATGGLDEKAVADKEDEILEPGEYTVKHSGGKYYNVLSPSGKVMNEKALKSEEAEALRGQLQTESE